MDEINLKGKMGNWGPFGENEGKWLIFTVGNPNEGHGLALPRMVDDFHAKYVAYQLEFKTGSRYVAHIPYTTDRCGIVAKDWAPQYIPEEEFIKKTEGFIRYHIKIYQEMGLKADKVLVIIGHGGNLGLIDVQDVLKANLKLSQFVCKFILDESYLNELPEESHSLFKTAGHASHVEHSLAAAMGVLDNAKLNEMNELIGSDFGKALKLWPPLGGLGGFLTVGGKYIEALGSTKKDKFELWKCLNALKAKGKIEIKKELAEKVIQITIDRLTKLILDDS